MDVRGGRAKGPKALEGDKSEGMTSDGKPWVTVEPEEEELSPSSAGRRWCKEEEEERWGEALARPGAAAAGWEPSPAPASWSAAAPRSEQDMPSGSSFLIQARWGGRWVRAGEPEAPWGRPRPIKGRAASPPKPSGSMLGGGPAEGFHPEEAAAAAAAAAVAAAAAATESLGMPAAPAICEAADAAGGPWWVPGPDGAGACAFGVGLAWAWSGGAPREDDAVLAVLLLVWSCA